ncbi:UDP-N-acetylmuramoyl-tripeptide--D-alanyl-D-alanine ligase [Moraxella bovis]|uniref:UDP-N-acetylmuramoyl-tripeptide--D-alanyl-D-alanine ligase n=1 Tax=Moraxella bovis TaxID=476 RepID=A0AAX3EUP1_MORBO|nr:UDP-N-acetylmuramoyl-tripeptide--D-alanyl-D-alanine ligase [Moraxella bovis]AWY21470.1 UDP-N-acetylmuramoyl-tripeptide--D-alanyl-D-alanine ligase [Moraxella bovis]OOR91127.1 UDP-N-acetylmuramoyl-tripeptide--D-alanyl-D-alanine ligase [Moraxella bovis]UYZ75658.1 UDP-N-acetylmuramoyl-tripeptide--D-alanyl-D-alanine ligase [Moraxella bovis]UYZ78400.1 UDP-N-acetylmuramoyl-tripeptide--D-alanyl-D-alanine ligase [Moraxella bovis]UYZ81287.1 UDP-N-acetylmuramoyl-tripeptide--D-alanyl-D-alanine ligase [
MTPYIWQFDNLNTALSELTPTWYGAFTAQSTKITTDTRTINAGDIFLAIKGDNFDGHEFVNAALEKGAVLAIVNEKVESDLPQLITGDSKKALGLLGKYRRDVHPNLTVIALTGSSGKTTTKEMLGSILNQLAPTLITRGNLNNDLGVPMMLLELCDEHQFAVMELGANHIGEIAYTTRLVSPDVACVLNIGTAHLGEFGGRENIAKTKAEIFQGLNENGVAVLPYGDEFFEILANEAGKFTAQILTTGEKNVPPREAMDFSKLSEAEQAELDKLDFVQVMGDVFADDVEVLADKVGFNLVVNLAVDEFDEGEVLLPFAGEHNVANALSAVACSLALGLDLELIVNGLNNAKPAKGRLNFKPFNNHLIIDDTYNANVPAMIAGLKVLNAQKFLDENAYDKTLMIIGDIGELGDDAVAEHQSLGEQIGEIGVDKLICVGKLMKNTFDPAQKAGINCVHFNDKSQVTQEILSTINTGENWAMLFKGSRFMAMETLIHDLTQPVSE